MSVSSCPRETAEVMRRRSFDEAHTVLVLPRDGEGDDSSIVAVELGGCAVMLGVAGKARVGDVGDPRIVGEERGDGLRVLAVTSQPQGQRDGRA